MRKTKLSFIGKKKYSTSCVRQDMARTDILDTLTGIKIQNFAHFKLHKSLVSLIKGPFTWWKEDPSTKKIREGEKNLSEVVTKWRRKKE